MVDSAIGPVPQGWEVKALRELETSIQNEISPRSAHRRDQLYRHSFVSTGSIVAQSSEMPFDRSHQIEQGASSDTGM